jgi:hypothetical protein
MKHAGPTRWQRFWEWINTPEPPYEHEEEGTE